MLLLLSGLIGEDRVSLGSEIKIFLHDAQHPTNINKNINMDMLTVLNKIRWHITKRVRYQNYLQQSFEQFNLYIDSQHFKFNLIFMRK
ncbi:hypothetical protein Lpp126_05905 [Lacticaseibacillus paracasei subsp. paracasei Lpp126]|uniref:Uncharacterized protein n=1 Tax=Lacticaseibacillus paracasei subsp. paracasei Lpp126 TaxID=1256206 RepID=S2RMQ9_LACPA|nr:hypothetical protein Lpp126_05905 [Lacticaseibacillus paracasei subsp. paracasei Lpp126]